MKSLLKSNLIIISTVFFFMVGCRKDPHHVEQPPTIDGCIEDWCDDFPPAPEIGYNYTSEGTQYLAPCFNPNNSDEFVYIRYLSSTQPQLVKYNLVTKQETILLDPMSLGRPDWGRQGWITFVYTFKHIWKIYEDGSQLTQLTDGVDDKFPSFNLSGDQIYYLRQKWYSNFDLSANPELYKNTKMLLMDLSGNILDSIMVGSIKNEYNSIFTYQTWFYGVTNSQGEIYFNDGVYPFEWMCVLKDDTTFKIKKWSSPQDIQDVDMYSTNLYYTKYQKGIFKMDINTGEETKLKWGCDTRHYKSISISSDGKKMLVQKVISTLYDNDQSIDEQNEIWLLDVNGCGEEKILGQ